MKRIIILGSNGSGKKTLKERLGTHLSDYNLDIYPGSLSSSYDAAILVVSLIGGPQRETGEHLLAAQNARIPNMFCFLNKNDLFMDKELQDLVYLECLELGKKYEYSEENFHVVIGSALQGKEMESLIELLRSDINKPYVQSNLKLPDFVCKRCGHIEHSPFDVCRVCNTKQKASFLKKLFGGS
jgi:translation initiation factor 2 gamma subunit (eIF-2gamma)